MAADATTADATTADPSRILVVDDNRLSRRMLARGVEAEGYEVLTADDGHAALRVMREHAVDAVLLDIVMPGLDGFGVLDAMQQDPNLRTIPVIVISALDEMDSVVRGIEMGAVDYLSKPFNPVVLAARLRASLQRKRLSDLQQAYVRQESILRQNEKLATLGRLSAGVAHELNNPTAATARAASQLREALRLQQACEAALASSGASADALSWLSEMAYSGDPATPELDPITRGDHESGIEVWLEQHGIDEPWSLSPALVDAGLDPGMLDAFTDRFDGSQLAAALELLTHRRSSGLLLEQVERLAGRISEIVAALKSYAYMDRAAVQDVDVHRGLEDTLVMLGSRLAHGIRVVRDYADDLPTITAYGSELNQVWTNLIDNAAAAMDGGGTLTIRTRPEGDGVRVDIGDTGPGVDDRVRSTLFEPFVTTKPPGQGTGLGLSISHSIVTGHHGGAITVDSGPEGTTFSVRLRRVPPPSG